MRQLSIDQFENEGRRVAMHSDAMGKPAVRTPLFEKQSSGHYTGLHKVSSPCHLQVVLQDNPSPVRLFSPGNLSLARFSRCHVSNLR